MNFPRVLTRLSAAGVLAAVAACGGGDSTAPRLTTTLSTDEAASLAVEMGMALSSTGTPSANVAAASVGSVPISNTLQMTVPCPKGGTTTIKGTVKGEYDPAGSISMDVTASQEQKDCGLLVKGVTFTLNGAPGISTTAHLATTVGTPGGTYTATTTGGFSWATSDGRSGNCTVNYAVNADQGAGTVKVTGNFCGTTLDYSGKFGD